VITFDGRQAHPRPTLTVAQRLQQGPREDLRAARTTSLRSVPVLPLRAGRHLAAWLVWHTTHVSLLEDATEPADRGGSAHPAG
jgi:hypothetical protein